MSTNGIIGIILAGLVIIGGGYYLINMDDLTESNPPTSDATANEESAAIDEADTRESNEVQTGEYEGTFAELMMRGESLECTIDASSIAELESGVMYVSGDNMRGEFVVNAEGYGQVESYMISNGEYVHTWSSMMPQGMTMPVETDSEVDTAISEQSFDVDAEYTYDCKEWSVDDSYFELPADINFMEMPVY